MKKTKKIFSILLCIMLALSFAAVPMMSFGVPDDPDSSAQEKPVDPPKEPTTTNKTKAPTTSSPTTKAKPKATPKTTPKNNNSNAGKLTVSSKRSSEGSGEGGKVKVIYTIENTGDVRATNIKLRDSDIAGSQTISEIDSLASGSSKTIEYEATMTRDSTSTPTVTCTMNGTSRTFTGESVRISLSGSSSSLSATLTTSTTDVQPNMPVKFSLLIKNDDTGRVTDISVSDYSGKSIKSGINLDGGSSTNVDFELTLTGDTNVYVNIKGKNSSGSEISSKSNELAMKANSSAVPVNEGLSILLYSDKTQLEKSGEVQLTLEVKNLMPKAYTNVSIIDKATGTNLQTISLLSGNDSKTYTSTIKVEQNTSLLYEATATYEDGTAVTVQSNSLEIKVGGGRMLSGSMLIIVIIIVIIVLLIIATSVTLYILSKKEKDKKKSLGAAQSEKYRKATPKKKGREPIAPPRQPLSTFSIEENNDDVPNIPSFDTSPIQIPKTDNSFDNYNNDDDFDNNNDYERNNLANTNPNEQYNPNEEFNAFANTNQSNPLDDEFEPNRDEYKQQQHQNHSEPMDYNDLDPD